MKSKFIASAILAGAACAAFADTTISGLAARQRWPWNGKVDIDFALSGDTADVELSATWDGHSEPLYLTNLFNVVAGQHRVEWDPASANLADQTLTGFSVTAKSATFADHKYIIVDLENGGYTFTNAVPEGGWTTEHKSTKMVFVRCPAGTYNNGISTSDSEYLSGQANFAYKTSWGSHTTTFTSDWYIGLFAVTEAQYNMITGASGGGYGPKTLSYNNWRGNTNDTPSVNWPHTKYAVTENTVVDRMRKLCGNTLCIDLPSEEQFESAMRGGTSTFWPSGGTSSDSFETLTQCVNQVANWYHTSGYISAAATPAAAVVGYYPDKANAWGICDTAGVGGASVCLDTVVPSGNRRYPARNVGSQTDPVGSSSYKSGDAALRRVVKGAGNGGQTTALWEMLPCARYLGEQTAPYAARLAIHLKPLNFGN